MLELQHTEFDKFSYPGREPIVWNPFFQKFQLFQTKKNVKKNVKKSSIHDTFLWWLLFFM